MNDPVILLSIGILFLGLTAFLFWPERGVFPRYKSFRKMSERVFHEDALKHIQKLALQNKYPSIQSIAGALEVSADQAAIILSSLEVQELISVVNGKWHLTQAGETVALQVLRAHRLLERFLAEKTGFSEEEWHQRAEKLEHSLTLQEIESLARTLGNPSHDPHGDPIPSSDGKVRLREGQSLTMFPINQNGRIIHIPDEPEAVAAQIRAEVIVPGMVVRVLESSPTRVRFLIGGEEHVLAPVVASNIIVSEVKEVPVEIIQGESLALLKIGEEGEVVSLSPRCRGAERRRLLDLGILPGTVVAAEFISPGGQPTAYRIRDSLIALRNDQADWIRIKPLIMEQAS